MQLIVQAIGDRVTDEKRMCIAKKEDKENNGGVKKKKTQEN